MNAGSDNKHATRSAQTRERFIQAAQELFAERGVDSVSLNEITVAAGQKNRNALQYHFGGRDGLLQAIIDKHASEVLALREQCLLALGDSDKPPALVMALALVSPLVQYIERQPQAIHYIKILSQLAAMNSAIINPSVGSRLTFQEYGEISVLGREALAHLKPAEAQRRMFLVVSVLFHGIADICRVSEAESAGRALKQRQAMFDQVTCAIAALLAAPAQE